MPVDIIVQNSKYFNQYKNGNTFSANTSDFNLNLAACVMEKVKWTATIDINWTFDSSKGVSMDWEDLGSNLFRFKKLSGSFADDGFSIGDNIDMRYVTSLSAYIADGDVTIVMQDWMYIQFSAAITGVTTATGNTISTWIKGKSSLTALIYEFGLAENSESFNTISKVSGSNQAFYSGNVALNTTRTMIKQGSYSDWLTGVATIRRIANPSTYVQRFEITHTFTVNPYYIDGQILNIENEILPPLYAGGNTLKHVFKFDFRTALSNPNTSKITIIDNVLGSVGYFGENMNGFNNLYSIVSTTYENSLAVSSTGVLVTGQTTIRVTISKSSGNFITTDKIGAFLSFLPDVGDYTNTTTDFDSNFLYDNLFCLANGVTVSQSGVIDEVKATVSGGNILLVIKTSYTTAQQTYLAAHSTPKFALAIQIGDITISNAGSDRLLLIAGVEEYSLTSDISDLFEVNIMRFYSHDMVSGVVAGSSDLIIWNEDGFEMVFNIKVNGNKNAVLNVLKIKLIAYNSASDDQIELDSYTFQLGNIVSSGIQQFNVNTTRGYTLASGSNYNKVTLVNSGNIAGWEHYSGTFAQKISWHEWIENLGVNTIFYNNSEPNDNLNYKASNYSGLNGYEIKINIQAEVYGEESSLGTSGVTIYNGLSPDLTIYDYDKDNLSPNERYTMTLETFTEDGVTNLGGAILTNGDNTLVKTTVVDNVFNFTTVWNFYGIHRLEIENSLGYAIEEFSSINTPPTGQILQPIASVTLLDMVVSGGNLIMKSLVDGSTVNVNNSYKLSSRIQSPTRSSELDIISFYHRRLTDANLTVTVVKSNNVTEWDFGDGSAVVTTNVTNKSYPPGEVLYLVTAHLFDFDDVTEWNATSDQFVGSFNWSNLLNVTNFIVSNSTQMTTLTSPITATAMTNFDVRNSALTSLNIAGLTGLGGTFNCSDSITLETLTLPTSSRPFTSFNCEDCKLNYFDITVLSAITETINMAFDFTNNAFTAAEVNNFLFDLDSISTGAFTGRVILMAGTNVAPDNSSGGVDGLAAKASLITKKFTVTTN